jgi:hypothetical protein
MEPLLIMIQPQLNHRASCHFLPVHITKTARALHLHAAADAAANDNDGVL